MSKRIIRVLSMVLTLVMMLSLSTPAFAWGGIDTGKGWDRQIDEDDFREIEPAEEVEEEEVYDYFQTDGSDGYQVTVEAPMGSLPMLAELRAEPVEIEEIREAVESVVEGEANILVALDISFWMNGIEIEPEEAVRVKISAPELLDKTNLSVVHIPDGEDPEKVNLVDEEGLSFALGANEVAFEADSFSVYVVVDDGQTDENARLHVHFKQADGSDVEILVKKTDMKTETIDGVEVNHFEQVLYDPGVGVIAEGKMFRGWTTKQDYTVADDASAKTIEGVRDEVAALLNAGVTEGQEITYYPMIFNARYVSYLDELGASIKNDLVLFKEGDTATYTVNETYTPREQDSRFDGWAVATYNDETEKYYIADGAKVYTNNETITFTENSESVVLMAFVPRGHWLIFKENAKGASYTGPQFILSEGKTARPADPTRVGYTFAGWFLPASVDEDGKPGTDADGNVLLGAEFTAWDDYLEETTTVYAKWTAVRTANYAVIIWKQNVAGTGYDFAQSITVTGGTVGEIADVSKQGDGDAAVARIDGTNYPFTGFHLKEFDQNVKIRPEGDSVVNVYYDRTSYTLTFMDYTYTQNNNGGYVYWPGGYYRSYSQWYGYTYSYYPEGYYSRSATNDSNEGDYGDGRSPVNNVNNNATVTYYVKNANGTYSAQTYTAHRFNRSNNRTTVKTITAVYEASITNEFPIVGSNGMTYDDGQRWKPVGSDNYTDVILSWEIMPAENVTFYMHPGTKRPLKTMNYYVEALPGATNYITYQGTRYTLYTTIKARYNMVTESEDFFDIKGFTKVTSDPAFSNGVALNDSSNDQTINMYYSRDKFTILYKDGEYVNGNGARIENKHNQTLDESVEIFYGGDLSSYNKGQADYNDKLTKTGFVFEGWYMDENCTREYTFTTMPDGGVVVYAKWRQIQYRVFLHPNVTEAQDPEFSMGGQATSFRLDYGDNITHLLGIRTDGYEQVGWYTDEAFTNAWNFDAYVGNDDNIKTSYDQKDNTELTTPFATVETGKDGVNSDNVNGRFWITRKLDLYAKWRLKLTGAEGIQVYYDAVAGTGEGTGAFADGSTLLYDPVGYYTDEAVSKAQGASTANAVNEEFKYWVIQKWDADKEEYVDVIGDDGEPMKVYPGGDFTVKKVYCREENIEGANPATDIYYLTYKMHLRAEYGSIEAPTPTHINWYSNLMDVAGLEMKLDNFGGTKTESVNEKGWVVKDRIVNGEDDLGINEAIDIRPADTYSYQGYTFLGWAKIASDKKPDAENPLSEADLFLKWDPDFEYTVEGETKKGAFLAKDDSGNFTVRATKVAADENQPYDDLYAVWKGEFYVYHSGVEGGNIETFDLTAETKSFDLTNTPEGLTEGTLYGGYYLEGGFRATAAGSGDGETGELDDGEGGSTISTAPSYAAYDGTNWTWTTPVRTEAGNAITPVAGTTYYIKEVPADKYLQPYLHYTYKWNDGTITASWLVSNVDDAKYKETGFLVISTAEDKAKVCNSLTVQNTGTQQTSIKLTTELVFNVTGGYLTYLPVMDANGAIASTGYDANCTIKQYWITPDGLAVTSANARTYVTIDSHYTIDKDAVDLDTVTAKSNIYTLADWQKSVPAC